MQARSMRLPLCRALSGATRWSQASFSRGGHLSVAAAHSTKACSLMSPLATSSSCSFSTAVSDLEKRRKQLTWRAKSRGWLELDVLMGTFTEKNIKNFDHAQMDLLEEVLELENPDLFKWFTGQAAVPDEIKENEIMQLMLEYINTAHPSGIGKGFTQ
mmetsp:Transcript_11285/g.25916  ORF Transcript_11285/g.25916 Transcript_11285/m.25916 type:complete len:158 (+) Transcript_11285:82-555(+)|eukprot:CAMPEP_0178437236 /NCGR_PEP_ID=MMETSP0689_2-20121128/34874_1 /TAXON_ID=160604 /ORGANISM="Amphidinium massartii, Strain CS-259" /LENGTH=157 /DNA_ID=CAMNT_0020059403 /DNA_START=39 /DNA_END=512 /DNA_ORIENTATION=-